MTSLTPEDAPAETTETLLAEVDARLRLLEAARPESLDGFALSSVSKLPFKALQYREGLLWRMAQLGRNAFECFKGDKLVSGILLTRATMEASASLWYLLAKLRTAVESKSLGDVDFYLMKLLMGGRTDLDLMPQALSVLTFVDHVEKSIEGFRHQYDRLSEFAHPNWAGTALLFSKIDRSRAVADFGENLRFADSARAIGVSNLSVALAMSEVSYNRITDLMPGFISVCEQHGDISGVD
jgi:hypothetical protein